MNDENCDWLKEKINPGSEITPNDIASWAGVTVETATVEQRKWDMIRLKLRAYVERWFFERHGHHTFVENSGLGLRVIDQSQTDEKSDQSISYAMRSIRKNTRICETTAAKVNDRNLQSSLRDKAARLKSMTGTSEWKSLRARLWMGRDAFGKNDGK